MRRRANGMILRSPGFIVGESAFCSVAEDFSFTKPSKTLPEDLCPIMQELQILIHEQVPRAPHKRWLNFLETSICSAKER